MRFQEKKEKELEKQRDDTCNHYRPMVAQGKEWRVKTSSQSAPVRPVEESVRPVTPVRLVAGTGQTGASRAPPGVGVYRQACSGIPLAVGFVGRDRRLLVDRESGY